MSKSRRRSNSCVVSLHASSAMTRSRCLCSNRSRDRSRSVSPTRTLASTASCTRVHGLSILELRDQVLGNWLAKVEPAFELLTGEPGLVQDPLDRLLKAIPRLGL